MGKMYRQLGPTLINAHHTQENVKTWWGYGWPALGGGYLLGDLNSNKFWQHIKFRGERERIATNHGAWMVHIEHCRVLPIQPFLI